MRLRKWFAGASDCSRVQTSEAERIGVNQFAQVLSGNNAGASDQSTPTCCAAGFSSASASQHAARSPPHRELMHAQRTYTSGGEGQVMTHSVCSGGTLHKPAVGCQGAGGAHPGPPPDSGRDALRCVRDVDVCLFLCPPLGALAFLRPPSIGQTRKDVIIQGTGSPQQHDSLALQALRCTPKTRAQVLLLAPTLAPAAAVLGLPGEHF